jgi:hypothetical protein
MGMCVCSRLRAASKRACAHRPPPPNTTTIPRARARTQTCFAFWAFNYPRKEKRLVMRNCTAVIPESEADFILWVLARGFSVNFDNRGFVKGLQGGLFPKKGRWLGCPAGASRGRAYSVLPPTETPLLAPHPRLSVCSPSAQRSGPRSAATRGHHRSTPVKKSRPPHLVAPSPTPPLPLVPPGTGARSLSRARRSPTGCDSSLGWTPTQWVAQPRLAFQAAAACWLPSCSALANATAHSAGTAAAAQPCSPTQDLSVGMN